LVCYIRKYVIILGGYYIPVDVPPTKILGMCPRHPGGIDASASDFRSLGLLDRRVVSDCAVRNVSDMTSSVCTVKV